ncbi:hypothetical protein QQF64_025930 [Cirrhinus molitorella]|uniref:Uncharacterized protein n=1 Tax=Cirrhinus molitorella TaxID=172907 RepID=A0ABR3NQD5_9TELE
MADIALPPPAPFLALPGAEGHVWLGRWSQSLHSNLTQAVELLTAHFGSPQSALIATFSVRRQRHQLPVIQPLRRIPLALRDGVSTELKQLLDSGIIEPVDASPWVSNLVVAQKKSGALRVCVDLRAVNKAVIPDRFPLPTSEELIAQFHGSTVFSKLDFRQGLLQVPSSTPAAETHSLRDPRSR